MRCSLFGKLPAKRDFIALFSPRIFLDVWEPWIQGSISASRQELGEDWQNAFLTAPIWRFWLGAELCRTPVAGALMSATARSLPRRTDVHLLIYSGTCGRPTMSTLTLPRASGGRWGAAIMLRMPCVAAGCPT